MFSNIFFMFLTEKLYKHNKVGKKQIFIANQSGRVKNILRNDKCEKANIFTSKLWKSQIVVSTYNIKRHC